VVAIFTVAQPLNQVIHSLTIPPPLFPGSPVGIHFAATPAIIIYSEMDHAWNATTHIGAYRFLHAHALCPGLLSQTLPGCRQLLRLPSKINHIIKKLNIQSPKKGESFSIKAF
jgi:hypothetical protein